MANNHTIGQLHIRRSYLLYLAVILPIFLVVNHYFSRFKMSSSEIKNVLIIGVSVFNLLCSRKAPHGSTLSYVDVIEESLRKLEANTSPKAGGNLGPTVLNIFLKHSVFNVTVLSRENSKSTFPPGVKVLRADFDSADSLTAAFQGQDAVLSLISGSVVGDQNKLIDAAIAAGVKRFVPSEYGSNTADERIISIVPILSAKKAMVDYLRTKEDRISWSAVINGLFFDWVSAVTCFTRDHLN
jgi:hypothetical protein